jgi:hypothetical protein
MTGTIKMTRKGILSLLDEKGVQLAFNTVNREQVTEGHIVRLRDFGEALGLGQIEVEKGLGKPEESRG